MNYKTYLKNKNLSVSTIQVYLKNYLKWVNYVKDSNPTKKLFVNYIRKYQTNHKPASVHLMYNSILSVFKFEKRWKLINECRDVKLPQSEHTFKHVISLNEFNQVFAQNIDFFNWHEKRDWIIFCFLFFTGVRVCELLKVNLKEIKDDKLLIRGKGNKTRIIYINNYLSELLKTWKYHKIAISKSKKLITYKQVYLIINNLTLKLFHKKISPHGLRRSYATNLLKSNINLEIVRKTLGHSNINTTSRYIQYTDDEILNEIKKVI